MKLTSENVTAVLKDCLFKEEENHDTFVKGEAVMTTFAFHPGRLESHKEDIRSMLTELPAPFNEDTGGGWTFLNACVTKEAHQWGEQMNVDELLGLGLAAGFIRYGLPRPYWKLLPGGMPYFMIIANPQPEQPHGHHT